MSQGALVVWFGLTGLAFLFVSVDIRNTPAHPVLKWAFVILTAFMGPIGAFLYVVGCREPLKDTHAAYVAVRWRQVLGSTMHCAAGDGVGIMAGAALLAYWQPPAWVDLPLEYLLGFGFGWAFFQAFAMRDMAGGSYLRSLRLTLFPEFVSMNLLMAGMFPMMRWLMPQIDGGGNPLAWGFWFLMSMALLTGFLLAYPINWWLVARHLKHGMITVRDDGVAMEAMREPTATSSPSVGIATKAVVALLTAGVLLLSAAFLG